MDHMMIWKKLSAPFVTVGIRKTTTSHFPWTVPVFKKITIPAKCAMVVAAKNGQAMGANTCGVDTKGDPSRSKNSNRH